MENCPYCGYLAHKGKCHLVKSFEYDESGNVKRVEFFSPNEYGQIATSVQVPSVWNHPHAVTWAVSNQRIPS